jgi:beta-N-acetylhexosaminidase
MLRRCAVVVAAIAAAGVGSAHAGTNPIASLTPAQLAGQRIIYAYAGLTPPPSLFARIRAGEAAGVIFFTSNISSASQIRRVIGALQRANASSPIKQPLLMLTDQEGGLVRRLPGAPLLSERQIATVAAASQAGAGAGLNLRGAGMNVNLSPVLDVYRQRGNFIDQYARAYSSNPAVVATLGGAFIRAQQATGVAATAKHFPGLGAASVMANTDDAPVTLSQSLGQLRAVDEAPYRNAIRAGVALVMVSWAIYPALDRLRPAGLSSAVIGGELRGRLGFRGVTITDGLGAGALARYGGFALRGVLAASAGADLLLCSTRLPQDDRPANGIATANGLAGALSSGRLSTAAAQAAVARIVALRATP